MLQQYPHSTCPITTTKYTLCLVGCGLGHPGTKTWLIMSYLVLGYVPGYLRSGYPAKTDSVFSRVYTLGYPGYHTWLFLSFSGVHRGIRGVYSPDRTHSQWYIVAVREELNRQ